MTPERFKFEVDLWDAIHRWAAGDCAARMKAVADVGRLIETRVQTDVARHVQAEVNDALQVIAERDAWEEFVDLMAQEIGCPEEWSNLHDHRTCVREFIEKYAAKPK